MKKVLLSILAVNLMATQLSAQLFQDNFEGYAAGYLGPQSTSWSTWSGTEGGSEDVQISTAQASSGTNSIYLSSTATNGGPQDVILKFGNVYTSGIFTYEQKMYINNGKKAHFNFQKTNTPGQVWTFNASFASGQFTLDDAVTPDLAVGSYPQATWFTIKIEANLTLHIWKVYIDNVLMGQWENSVNQVATCDIFPVNGAQFYIDDVMFDHQTYTLPTLNAMAANLDMDGNIATQNVSPVATVKNAGSTVINSFDIELDYDGQQYTQNITGLNLASLANYNVTFNGISLAAGSNVATVTISNINGGADDVLTDDVITQTVNPVVPALGKVVVGEEGTGTWCQWCPRGAVYMDMYEEEFGEFWAGVAVHNGDPMTVTSYDAGIGALISGYPSSVVDRGADVDPSGMSTDFYARLQTAPKAFISNGATFDANTRELKVSITTDFQASATSSYKVACVLTEDDVTGTGSGYNQSNAYAGGGNGVMGGFESLPNPVPAAQMVYNHVGRAIAPSFGGYASAFPATVNSGETYTFNFSFILPATWDETKMHIIGMLIAPNGTIDNAGKATIQQAIDSGYVNGTAVAGLETMSFDPENTMKIYPNPANEFTNVILNIKEQANVSLKLMDLQGKEISIKNYGSLNGMKEININTSHLNAGVYFIELNLDGNKNVQRLIVE